MKNLQPQIILYKDLNILRYINRYTMRKQEKRKQSKRPMNILRYPRLDTVLMVEKAIRKYDGSFRKKKLWEHLPKKMMYQTYCVVIDYLLHSHKISVDAEGKIGWIWYPEEARKAYRELPGMNYEPSVNNKIRKH